MWHEARKQEKKIRGMMVDYKRRAERRRDYYERIKQDPAQFLQVHGRPARIHLDPAIAIAGDSPATMMPWQGNAENLIDRFDVRAHLDIIPEYASKAEESMPEDRQSSYERYRTLVQNDFLSVNEDKFLHQIFIEERFGIFKPDDEKKKPTDKKAAIGYVYEDSTEMPPVPTITCNALKEFGVDEDEDNEEEKEEDLSDIDLDVTVDVNMLTQEQCAEMNTHSHKYGMVDDDFITYLHQDKNEAEQLKLAREIEEEKAMYSGRKSRRERRALREKKLAGRKITSPPSYAARESPTYTPMRNSTSKSRSRSPPEAGKIMFITSFGGEGSDGEQLVKPVASNSKQAKCSKSKDASDSVIGPHLPSKNGDDPKPSKSSKSSHGGDSSRSHRSKHREHSRRAGRRSSGSSSGRSASPRKSGSSSLKRRRPRRSRSRSYSPSRSSSRSRNKSSRKTHSRSPSRSRSKSVSNVKDKNSASPQLPPPPVKSYYRHSLSRSTSEYSDESYEDDKSPDHNQQLPTIGGSRLQPLTGKAAATTKAKLTPQERLKRKMQLALKKQYKADKKAQMEKSEKQLQERQDRAEELREMAIKLRQRERERRHKTRGYDYSSDSDSTWTKNPSHAPHEGGSKRKEASSRSGSSSSGSGSPAPSASSGRRKSRSTTPPRRRSPERRRSPYRKRSPPRRSSPPRVFRRTPPRGDRYQSGSDRRYSPPHRRSSPGRRYSPGRNDSRRYASHRPSRKESPRRSPVRNYGSRPLVDY